MTRRVEVTPHGEVTRRVEVTRVTKAYGARTVVRDVSFRIEGGEVYGLLGPNGAGKTTTLSIVATLVAPDTGDARVGGLSVVAARSAVRRRLGLVPQRVSLYPSLTVEENLRFFAALYGLDGDRLRGRVDALLALSGLEARRADVVSECSGGMQRRLNLACGLVHEPELLLLDEPTVGIDPQSRERIFDAVAALAAGGLSILYTTHYMEEAERLCHRVGILDEGRLVGEGTPAELASLVGRGEIVFLALQDDASPPLRERLEKRGAQEISPRRYRLVTGASLRDVPVLLKWVAESGGAVSELTVHRPNLGEAFFHLTGKELRD